MSTELERRVETLEREVQMLKEQLAKGNGEKDWRSTFGMFANDPEFAEIIRLGREYREEERRRELHELLDS